MPPKPTVVQAPPTAQQAAAAAQQKAYAAGISEFELPKSNLTKLAKGSVPDNVKMQQDVVLALLRGSTLFINYLTVARSGKTITASDVIKAITDLDFGPADALVPLLEQELQSYRNIVAAAKLAKKGPAPAKGKGRKSTGTVNDTDVEMVEDDEDEAGDDVEGDEAEEEGEGEGDGDEDEGGGQGQNGAGDETELIEAENQDQDIEEGQEEEL
ncbi:uncharacterized protein IL334_001297 [Kwoniella shivajii]|uniref:DNA polymerase epsilon subunit D n=1 Tax=Kwoniella shivajii TaxID=564305 RepID=A0ABZ1CRW4_9TREE|nr:hypothetical protein IL334_001297 [Kwoniella shivajii]